MRQRPETAYSISKYKVLPRSYGNETDLKPHTSLERRKFANQISICSVTPRRQDLIKSTEIKTKKEIHEWIEQKHPNGIQILQQIVKKTRSPYRPLIQKALGDLLIVEQIANKLDEEALAEKSQNQSHIEEEIEKYQKKLINLKNERELLRNEIKSNESKLMSMSDDIRNFQTVMKSVKSRISSSDEYEYDEEGDSNELNFSDKSETSLGQRKTRKKVSKVVDDETLPKDVRISLYNEEEQKLEQKLTKLEATLLELTLEERKLLNSPYIVPQQE